MLIGGLGLFSIIAGFILGLGAVTVIDLHGFLAQKSSYWTEATTRSHKITKPLIWLGISLFLFGTFAFWHNYLFNTIHLLQLGLGILLVINGLFLTFVVSPFLVNREKQGRQKELLPKNLQWKIRVSFLFSFFGWWSEVVLFVWILLTSLYSKV